MTMPKCNEIIKQVRNALDTTVENWSTKNAGYWPRPECTKAVKEALCLWGLQRGFFVCAGGVKELVKANPTMTQGEWLYDITCLEYDRKGWLKRVPLVVECEWGFKYEQVPKDFRKLLLARADVRVMIFNGNHWGGARRQPDGRPAWAVSHHLQELKRYAVKFKDSGSGDTYLFVARLHDKGENGPENYRFDYETFIVP